MWRARQRPRAVFLGLSEIAGFYAGLQQGFSELGVQADVVTIRPYAYADEPHSLQSEDADAMVRWIRRTIRDEGWLGARLARELIVRVRIMVWAVGRYDAFVFGFRNSFLVGWDLPVLRLMGKRIVCVFHGSDSRPAYVDRQSGEGKDGRALARRVRRRKRVVRRMERWSHQVVVGALTTQLHGRRVVCFQALGIPVTSGASERRSSGDRLRVVHAPTHPATKGTSAIRAALAELAREGFEFEYVELIGVPNKVVRDTLGEAELLVDQLYSDTLLAGLGAEAAATGCASIVGGYELDMLQAHLRSDMIPPAYYCEPSNVLETLRRVLVDRDALRAQGEAVRLFVAEHWSPRAVAARYMRLLVDDVPDAWTVDPSQCLAVAGCGVDRETARARCRSVIQACGPGGLALDDKPALRAAYVASAEAD